MFFFLYHYLAVKGEVVEAGSKSCETAKSTGSQYYRQDISISDGTREVCYLCIYNII